MNKIFDAELEIIQFNVNDIITTSNGNDLGDWDLDSAQFTGE